MKGILIAREAFQALNLATELMVAGSSIVASINAAHAKRDAEGSELTREDLQQLMADGDVKAALERAALVQAQLAQLGSAQASEAGAQPKVDAVG
jgi:hypothetical protein